jgi:hypothetical protein
MITAKLHTTHVLQRAQKHRLSQAEFAGPDFEVVALAAHSQHDLDLSPEALARADAVLMWHTLQADKMVLEHMKVRFIV